MSEQRQRDPFSYRELGDIDQFPELVAIWNAIWKRQASVKLTSGETIYTRPFKGGELYGVDYKGKRYIQQNPNTHSAYADRAKQGSKIIWVIRTEGMESKYLGYIEDGQVFLK